MTGRSDRVALVALVLAAFGLRQQLVGTGPLLPRIASDLDASFAVAGLLTTVPIALMGALAVPGVIIGQRSGPRAAMGWSLALIGGGGIVRAVAPDMVLVLAFTVPIGVGMGISGVVLAMFVKRRLPTIPGMATGLYTFGMIAGTALAATLAEPIAALTGDWRVPLLLSGAIVSLLCGGWLLLVRDDRAERAVAIRRPQIPWRRPVAWLLVVIFCLQALIFFGLATWLVPALTERGYSPSEASAVLGLMTVSGIAGTLLVSWIGERFSRRGALVLTSIAVTVASAGFAALPALAWVWAVTTGIGLAAVFALVMTLPLDAVDRPEATGDLTAMMLGLGYGFSAVVPALMGAVRDATGTFTGSLWLLVAASVALVITAAAAGRERLRAGRLASVPAGPIAGP